MPPSRNAGTSGTRKTQRFFLLMTFNPRTRSTRLGGEDSAIGERPANIGQTINPKIFERTKENLRPWAGGSCAHTAGFSLPANLQAGSATRSGATRTAAIGDHLDPEGILVLEVRGVAGLAQRIEAALLRTRGCGGEALQ